MIPPIKKWKTYIETINDKVLSLEFRMGDLTAFHVPVEREREIIRAVFDQFWPDTEAKKKKNDVFKLDF